MSTPPPEHSFYQKAWQLSHEPEPFSETGYLSSHLAKFNFQNPLDWTLFRGRYEEALEVLHEGLTLHPEDPDLNILTGNLRVTLGQYSEALSHYLKVAPFGEPSPLHLNIGVLHEMMGDRHKCFDHYRWAAHDPELSLLASYLLAFPGSEFSSNPDIIEKIRDWLNNALDRQPVQKESTTHQSPLDILRGLWKGKPSCPLCGNKETRLLLKDSANQDRPVRICQNCHIPYVYPQPEFQEVESWYGNQYFAASLDPARDIFRRWKDSMKSGGDLFLPTGKQFSLVFQWLESTGLSDLEQKKPRKMLDVGCATGGLIAEFISRGWEADGVELSPSAVGFCQEMGFSVQQGTLDTLHFPAQSYDLVTLTHVIEHLPDTRKTLTEACRLLKPGGGLFIRTPNSESLPRLLAGDPWFSDHDHLFFFGNRSITSLLESCGFRVIEIKSYVGIDIETWRHTWDRLRLNDLVRSRINQGNIGDVLLLFAVKQ